jgi:hypothetical protein
MVNAWRGSIKERKAQKQVLATYLGLATWRINTRRLAGKPMNIEDQFGVGLMELG